MTILIIYFIHSYQYYMQTFRSHGEQTHFIHAQTARSIHGLLCSYQFSTTCSAKPLSCLKCHAKCTCRAIDMLMQIHEFIYECQWRQFMYRVNPALQSIFRGRKDRRRGSCVLRAMTYLAHQRKSGIMQRGI
jgi:hypothetical protein